MLKASSVFLNILSDNRIGRHKGIYSVCSAHPAVLEAAMLQAKEDGSILLIESTSNQVDQYGGYTGMKPADFILYVHKAAKKTDFDENNILFGGDHLGPNSWQKENAQEAMIKAKELIRDYVAAGFEKIHLDASMFCADDAGDRHKPLSDNIVADRASELCMTAEETWKELRSDNPKPFYIIGTEVPVPGGAREKEEGVNVTECDAVNQTIEITKDYFKTKGLEDAWNRVYGVVAQPGVEFGNDQIFDYNRKKAVKLSKNIETHRNLVYEAHSTDYQTMKNLSEMVEDHFCILKVGPWLTFAYREAIFALADIEMEWLEKKRGVKLSNLKETLEKVMMKNDIYWKRYYPGDEEEQRFARKYSLSDRSRYYWVDSLLQQSIDRLLSNLSGNHIPLPLVSQYLPEQHYAVREGRIDNSPKSLVLDKIRSVLRIYSKVCGLC